MATADPEDVSGPSVRWVFYAVLAGTLVRLLYGVVFEPWSQQADQLAWGMVLSTTGPDAPTLYQRLVHYPHEGGTVLLSLLALLTGPLGNLPALSVAALLFDTLSRLIQLSVARSLFRAQAFQWFAAWTVIPLPGLLPWGTVNYGLHALAAFVPFVLLWCCSRPQSTRAGHMLDGMLTAGMVWFSYATLPLVPLYFLFRPDFSKHVRHWGGFLAGLAIILALHAAMRSAADAGFHLPGFGASSIRGMVLEAPADKVFHQLPETWISSLPGASLLPSMAGIPVVLVRRAWAFLLSVGLVCCAISWRRKQNGADPAFFCLLATIIFTTVYAASPFFHGRADRDAFVHYRHWAFILPIASMGAIAGLCMFRQGVPVLLAHAFLCITGALLIFTSPIDRERKPKEIGYVLAIKFGHEPRVLSAIARGYPEIQADVLRGAGWGTAEVLLSFHRPTQPDLDSLAALVRRYEGRERAWFREGLAPALSRNAMRDLPSGMRAQVQALIPTPPAER